MEVEHELWGEQHGLELCHTGKGEG